MGSRFGAAGLSAGCALKAESTRRLSKKNNNN
jgi:hypothetical protein